MTLLLPSARGAAGYAYDAYDPVADDDQLADQGHHPGSVGQILAACTAESRLSVIARVINVVPRIGYDTYDAPFNRTPVKWHYG
jgi:hypothetical protein